MKIDDRQKLLVTVAIVAVALFAGDKLVFTPLTALWKSRSERITEVRGEIEKGAGVVSRETSLRTHWDKLQKSSLPTDDSETESKVLTAVDRWMKASGIGLSAIKSQWKQNGDDYKTLEYRVDATGDIESLMHFLDELERDPLAVRVEDLELSVRDDTGQQLSLGVRFSALVLTGAQG